MLLKLLLPALCFSTALVAQSSDEARTSRPNILFLFADDHRPDAVGAFGNAHIKTPHIDSLAQRGFRFSRNYCMGSIHGAVCQPSRAMLMSGRTLYRVPMNLAGAETFPEILRRDGYATFGTGKWHNGKPAFLRSFENAKAVFFGGMCDHLKVPIHDIRPDGTLSKRRIATRFSSTLFADSTIEFLNSQDGERPFLAYVSFTAPHDPRQPPLRYRKMYYEARPPLPPNFLPQHPFHNGWMTGRDEKLAAWPRTRKVISDQLAEYYGLITHMDEQIGRILATLKKNGQAKNTLIVFSADHGLAVGSHGLLGKQSLYEHSMGAPLVLCGPGIPRGTSDALTYLFDLHPTICDYARTKASSSAEGQSLRPLIEGEKPRLRDTLFTTYENLMRAVRDDRYKLIRYPRIDHTQLFDLKTDPHEMKDLAAKTEQKERIQRMTTLLREWQKKTNDPHPLSIAKPQSRDIDLSGRKRKPDRHQPDWIVKKYFEQSR